MRNVRLKYILVVFLVIFASAAAAEEWIMDPAPVDRPKHDYRRGPGELKLNKYGMIDTTPDVISLEYLPKDRYGFVDWVKAIDDGVIAPRDSLRARKPKGKKARFDKNILIKSKMDFMPDVIFPHKEHNEWLKCSNCHPRIFKMKAGGNPITMVGIWQGEFCGRCHDRVAFPTRNCFKCHSVKKVYMNTGR
jgi:c(7)-type cytochrome triheme protein